MKRIILFVAALACGVGAQAQTNQLEKELKTADSVCDSIATMLAQCRVDYVAQNDSIRAKMAPTILSLEKELVVARAKYDKVLAAIMQRDVQREVQAYQASIKVDATAVAPQPVVDEKQVTTVIADYEKSFNVPHPQEVEVGALATQYFEKYQEYLDLQKKYMKAETRGEADNYAYLFANVHNELKTLDAKIAAQWHQFYYDRIYAYNILAERSGNSKIHKFSDLHTRAKIREASGKYISDALVDYYISRELLLEYEIHIASTLSLTSSSAKLLERMAEFKKINPYLAKLTLARRNFITYEDISVKTPTIYTSSNPVPKTQVEEYGEVYRVRIGSFTRKINPSSLRGVMPLSYIYEDNEYSYFAGGFRTEAEASEAARRLKGLGFREPVVAVWVDGAYYPTVEEMRQYESQYNIKISGVTTLISDVEAAIRANNSDCEIKREGGAFVVGPFVGQTVVNKVVTEIKALDTEMNVEIEKQNLK